MHPILMMRQFDYSGHRTWRHRTELHPRTSANTHQDQMCQQKSPDYRKKVRAASTFKIRPHVNRLLQYVANKTTQTQTHTGRKDISPNPPSSSNIFKSTSVPPFIASRKAIAFGSPLDKADISAIGSVGKGLCEAAGKGGETGKELNVPGMCDEIGD